MRVPSSRGYLAERTSSGWISTLPSSACASAAWIRDGSSCAGPTASSSSAAIEIVSVIVVDNHAARTGCDERVENLVFEDDVDAGYRLICVVASHDALVHPRIVRSSDFRVQHQLHIEERKRAEEDDVAGLFPFLA